MTHFKRVSLLFVAVILAAVIGGLAAVWQYRGNLPGQTTAPVASTGPSGAPPTAGAPASAATAQAAVPATPVPESPAWAKLTPAQKEALAPLAQEWGSMGEKRREKWLAIASRYHHLSPEGRKRLHDRMTEWVNMTPQQRQMAREAYQNSKSVPLSKKAEAWQKYQSLTDEQKKKLAAEEKGRHRPSVVSAPPSGRPEVKNPYGVVHRQSPPAPEAGASSGNPVTPPPAAAPPAAAPSSPSSPSSLPPPPLQPDIYSH